MRASALLGLVVGLTTLTLATSVATAQAAGPSPRPYVALGDSYAAGTGAGSYLSTTPSCHRSLLGYPGRIAATNGLALDLQACSGALVSDVTSLQLGSLNASTAFVTITVGGNDIGFSNVISTCLGTNTTACLNAVTAANATAKNVLPARLDAVFSAVKSKAPAATIVATNYPRLFNGKNCSLFTSFTSAEMTALNAGADTLSGVISDATVRNGIKFADVQPPFVGNAVCSSSPWINNLSLFTQYNSFHPNSTGYLSGYTPGVTTSLAVVPAPLNAKATVTTGGLTSSDTSRGQVRAAS